MVLESAEVSSLALSVTSGILGTLACLLFLCVVHRAGVVRALVLRQLEVSVVLAIRLWLLGAGSSAGGGGGERPFALSDLAGMALGLAGVAIVAVETLFF